MTTFPGFDAKSVGFDQPYEMLEACHDRVRARLALLRRLIEHVRTKGHDGESRSAAADVLRYFDVAAPLHHEDEERHVFPVLLQNADPHMVEIVQGLQSDHDQMSVLWAGLRLTLSQWMRTDSSGDVKAGLLDNAVAFLALYDAHLQTEERDVFPAALAFTNAHVMEQMGAEMRARRQTC